MAIPCRTPCISNIILIGVVEYLCCGGAVVAGCCCGQSVRIAGIARYLIFVNQNGGIGRNLLCYTAVLINVKRVVGVRREYRIDKRCAAAVDTVLHIAEGVVLPVGREL